MNNKPLRINMVHFILLLTNIASAMECKQQTYTMCEQYPKCNVHRLESSSSDKSAWWAQPSLHYWFTQCRSVCFPTTPYLTHGWVDGTILGLLLNFSEDNSWTLAKNLRTPREECRSLKSISAIPALPLWELTRIHWPWPPWYNNNKGSTHLISRISFLCGLAPRRGIPTSYSEDALRMRKQTWPPQTR